MIGNRILELFAELLTASFGDVIGVRIVSPEFVGKELGYQMAHEADQHL